MTTQELLDDVQAAITACLAGQEVTIRGRTVKRPVLKDLMAWEQALQNRLSGEGQSMSQVIQLDRPR